MSHSIPFRYISDTDIAALGLTTGEIADCIETAVRDQIAGRVWAAPKSSLLPGDGRYMMATLAVSEPAGLTAVKSVMVSPDNPARGLPAINGGILLLDCHTGAIVAVTDAVWITAVRTAALSVIMARRLANPQSSSVAFVGTGQQARSHLTALADLFPLREVLVSGRGQANIDQLCDMARGMGLDARSCKTPREALESADIVISSVTLNYKVEPFLDAGWLKPGAFVSVTDLAIPWKPASMRAFDALYVDDHAQEAIMEKPMVNPTQITGDLGAVVSGQTPAAFDPQGRSAFVFRGLSIADLAAAALIYQKLKD